MALRTANDLFQIIPAYSRTSYWNTILGTTSVLEWFPRTTWNFSLILAHAVLDNRPTIQVGFITKNNYTVQKIIRRVGFVLIKEKYFILYMFR